MALQQSIKPYVYKSGYVNAFFEYVSIFTMIIPKTGTLHGIARNGEGARGG